jgi:dCMP deaminase
MKPNSTTKYLIKQMKNLKETNPWAWSIGQRDNARNLNWDHYFLDIAKVVASKSKDPSTKTGAVIVSPKNTVVSIGYNGFPRNMRDDAELYANREKKYARVIHCEMNAMIFAREPLDGYTLYTWPFASCDRCCVHMIQAGITRMVAPRLPDHLVERWAASLELTKSYCDEAGVTLDLIEYE